jgi:uncharacterized protein YijF (DUF1287 family)
VLTRRDLIIAAAAAVLSTHAPSALVRAARRQIRVTTGYSGAYRPIAYPGGDVPRSTGACADVLVRAARDAWGLDLQRLVHEDMGRAFSDYPQCWGLRAPDPNIDHRRVANLEVFLARQGAALWRPARPAWPMGFPGPLRAGDILTWRTFLRGPHIAIVSHGGTWPRVIQNHGFGVREDWLAQQWLDIAAGWFRWRPDYPGAVRPRSQTPTIRKGPGSLSRTTPSCSASKAASSVSNRQWRAMGG